MTATGSEPPTFSRTTPGRPSGICLPAATLNRAHVHEPSGSQFVNHHRGGDTVAAAVGGNAGWQLRPIAGRRIDDGEPCARLGRRIETLVERCRLSDVVIDVSQEQRFTTLVRKIGRGGSALDHGDIGQPFLLGVFRAVVSDRCVMSVA